MNPAWHRGVNAFVFIVMIASIAFVSRDSIILGGIDTVHHFVLVDELAQHHSILPEDASRLDVMATYPSGSHWLAALLTPFAGSGLVAMAWVAIGSIFICYAMLFWLALRDLNLASAAMLFTILFLSFPLRSIIGWEVIGNFFYPQLVANALALAFLCSIVRSVTIERLLPALTPLAGAILMNFHPLVAIQIMGAGLCIMASSIIAKRVSRTALALRDFLQIGLSAALCLIAMATSPQFWMMRNVADWNGDLAVGFSHASIAIALATIISVGLIWLFVSGRGSRTDGIIGSALISSAMLMALQDIAWIVFHAGSPYAVKKHLFIVTTLLALGGARLLARLFNETYRPFTGPAELAAAAILTISIVLGHLTPAETILAPLRYAREASRQLSAAPASLASADLNAPVIVNIIVSVIGFHQINGRKTYFAYLFGDGGQALANRVMIRRSGDLDDKCPTQMIPTEVYSIVESECLLRYDIGKKISFGIAGNAAPYIQASEWSVPEAWGRWAVGEKGSSVKLLTGGNTPALDLKVVATALRRPDRPRKIHVKCNGSEIAVWQMSDALDSTPYSATIPENLLSSGLIEISFVPEETIIPGSQDQRELGIGMQSLVLTRSKNR